MIGSSISFPKKVFYGRGTIRELEDVIDKYNSIALFSYGSAKNNKAYLDLINILNERDKKFVEISSIPAEPTYTEVQEIYDSISEYSLELMIAFGGGSVIDTVKLLSIMSDETSIKDLIDNPNVGVKNVTTVVIPTTCGTGAEATQNGIVLIPEKNIKHGIVNSEMLPDVVVLDSVTIDTLPKKAIAYTGVDALCHAIECYTSKKANPISDMFSLEALRLIYKNLESAFLTGDLEAKEEMLLASFYAGLAISSSGTTAVHALSYPLGGKYKLAHGLSNAMLLLPVMIENEDYIGKELSEVYDYINSSGEGVSNKSEWILKWLEDLLDTLEIPKSLKEFNISESDLEYLSESAFNVKRLLDNNMKEYDLNTIKNIYLKLL